MRTFDFAPLWRSTVGFDRLFDLINHAQQADVQDGYPPYDVLRTGEDKYRIVLALAGFGPDEISITFQQNKLTIAAARKREPADKPSHREVLYRGISARPFERHFDLADHVEVESATFENGLLQIDLMRKLPEAMKPRKIAIRKLGNDNQKIEHEAAA
jgi:molecular chaperone IbpA